LQVQILFLAGSFLRSQNLLLLSRNTTCINSDAGPDSALLWISLLLTLMFSGNIPRRPCALIVVRCPKLLLNHEVKSVHLSIIIP
jgi:hypothetical protein